VKDPTDYGGSDSAYRTHSDEYLKIVSEIKMCRCKCDYPKYAPQYQQGIRIGRSYGSVGLDRNILNCR